MQKGEPFGVEFGLQGGVVNQLSHRGVTPLRWRPQLALRRVEHSLTIVSGATEDSGT